MNKKVLVTGAGGFIGSHLCEKLVEQGYKVKAFLRYNSRNFWGWLESSPYKSKIEIFSGDIRNYDNVSAAFKEVKIVFNLAALIGIPYSYSSPDGYVDTNIKGTLNMLQSAKDRGIKKFVHISTSEVYGTAKFIPMSEAHPLNPQSPYAATKAAADFLALSFYRSFGLPVTVVRPFNTYGPRQSARAVIPTIIAQLVSGRRTIRLGSLSPRRDLTYVQDTAEGMIRAAQTQQSTGEVINLGSNFEISVQALVKIISGIIGVRAKIECDKDRFRPDKSEVQRLCADITKARKLLRWAPRYSLEKGLTKTVDWFKLHKDIYKPRIYNV